MDVRCERCQTEYELADASVDAEGTDVLCTTCGYTFTVRPTPAVTGVAAAAALLVETADGRVHPFADLPALQAWIIEGKVTGTDRLSRGGGDWRRLWDVAELAPFFDRLAAVEAARARVAVGRSPSAQEELPAFRDPGDRASPREGRKSGYRSSEIMAVEAPGNDEEVNTSIIRTRGGGGLWKLLVSAGVAAGVAYVGITRLPVPGETAPARTESSSAARSVALDGAAAVTSSDAGAAVVATGAPSVTGADAGAAVTTAVAASAPAPATTPSAPPAGDASAAVAAGEAPTAMKVAGGDGGGAKADDDATAAGARAGAPSPEKPEAAAPEIPYGRLVAEADRLMEVGGATARAQRLYARALRQQPDGAEALAGLGYVNLERKRIEPAIGYFKRALTIAPYAPAMFGLAEAYRASGAREDAVKAYDRYLTVAPSGSEAAAARRQIQNLSSAPGDEPPPSSILQEGAKP